MKYLIQENLQNYCSAHDLNKWFEPLNIYYDKENTKLFVIFPHAFFESWFVEQGKNNFEQAVKNISMQNFGLIPKIEYVISSSTQKKPHDFYASFLKNKQINHINKSFTNFLYNKKNELTLATSKEIAKNKVIYNPFLIYGKSGSGKTHILNAIYSDLLNFKKNIFFGSANNFYENISTSNIESFVNKFSTFIIDDFHHISVNDDFSPLIIQFIDICIAKKKQLIFATSLPLTAKKKYTEALLSRLTMGLDVKLAKPDIDVRMRFAFTFCNEQNIKISKNQILSISQRCNTIAMMCGILLKVKAFTKLSPKKLSDSELENILTSLGEEKKSITSQDIINISSQYFNIDKKQILNGSRQPQIVQARQIAMYLCRDLLGLSYPNIGKMFGGKDHSTVMYSIKKINLLIDKNKNMQHAVAKIKQKCLSG